jgi:hypothetical protein
MIASLDYNSKQLRSAMWRVLNRNGMSNRRVTHNQTVLDEQEMGRVHLDFIRSFMATKAITLVTYRFFLKQQRI